MKTISKTSETPFLFAYLLVFLCHTPGNSAWRIVCGKKKKITCWMNKWMDKSKSWHELMNSFSLSRSKWTFPPTYFHWSEIISFYFMLMFTLKLKYSFCNAIQKTSPGLGSRILLVEVMPHVTCWVVLSFAFHHMLLPQLLSHLHSHRVCIPLPPPSHSPKQQPKEYFKSQLSLCSKPASGLLP